jgi:hypothetical protein
VLIVTPTTTASLLLTMADGGNTNQPGAGSGSGLPQTGLAVDSISLGQLRSMVNNSQRPKQSWFDFKYDDEDTVMNEIEEFYSYVEMPQSAENLKAWEGCFPSGVLGTVITIGRKCD